MNKIPIVFAINNSYVKQLSTVITSIIKNGKNNHFEFNILSSDITYENVVKINDFTEKLSNGKSQAKFIDMKPFIKDIDIEKYMSRREGYKYISADTYFRFFIPDIFSDYSKIIYLDADIIVLDDLSKLFTEDINDYYAGVVEDTYLSLCICDKERKTSVRPDLNYCQYLKQKLKKTNTKYFNAGILLLNLDKIRNTTNNLWNFTFKESPLEFLDQDVLNSLWENNVKYLDYKWNISKGLNAQIPAIKDKRIRKYLKKIYKKPSIYHYVGNDKPWLICNSNYNYSFIKTWWNYYKLTPYFKKEEILILKHIERLKNNSKRYDYIIFNIFNFIVLNFYKTNGRCYFNLLNLLKFNIKIREPKLSIKMEL